MARTMVAMQHATALLPCRWFDAQRRDAHRNTRTTLGRLLVEDDGQDFVEYALLTGFLGLGVLGGFGAIQNSLTTSYTNWDTGTQGLWVPPDPMGGGS